MRKAEIHSFLFFWRKTNSYMLQAWSPADHFLQLLCKYYVKRERLPHSLTPTNPTSHSKSLALSVLGNKTLIAQTSTISLQITRPQLHISAYYTKHRGEKKGIGKKILLHIKNEDLPLISNVSSTHFTAVYHLLLMSGMLDHDEPSLLKPGPRLSPWFRWHDPHTWLHISDTRGTRSGNI